MYIYNFTHYLNEEGNIPTTTPKEARELANFLAFVRMHQLTMSPNLALKRALGVLMRDVVYDPE